MKKVFIDPGHGGKDPGAVGINGLNEKDIVLSVSLLVGKVLERHNVKVFYSRTKDEFIELSERARMANKLETNVFISIHVNDFSNPQAQGLETYSHPSSKNGTALAKCIQDSLLKDKLYTKDRGIKTANFQVLRETKMTATLTELGFINNPEDILILKNKQNELSESVAKGILNFLGIKYIEIKAPIITKPGFNILSKTNTTIDQMKEWAKRKGANQKFIDLAPIFYSVSNKVGVNPLVTYCQSAKETGYFKFGGVLNSSYNNPCGLKISEGGGNYDPNAHKRFKSWEEGIQAQVDHLALYAGANGYPKLNTPDPRHFPYLKGTATTVESLGGKWAPSESYGNDIFSMIKELERTIAPIKPIGQTIRINLLGKQMTVDGTTKDGTTYIKVDGKDISLRSIFESMGFEVTWENNMVVIK